MEIEVDEEISQGIRSSAPSPPARGDAAPLARPRAAFASCGSSTSSAKQTSCGSKDVRARAFQPECDTSTRSRSPKTPSRGTKSSMPRQRAKKKSKDEVLSAAEMWFALDAPPPVSISASELLTRTADRLPVELRCIASHFDADCCCRDACLLMTHTFWYTFCALLQPGTEQTQTHLLRLMGQQVARLTLSLRCDKDTFFDHFPPLLAHAVLLGLSRHQALPTPGSAHACAVLHHIVALLGGLVPRDLLAGHVRHAEQNAAPRVSSSVLPPARHTRQVVPTPPPLMCWSVPPLLAVRRDGVPPAPAPGGHAHPPAASGARAADVPAGRLPARLLSRSSGALNPIAISSQSTKPTKLPVDLRRQSPLIALFNGLPPELPAPTYPPLPRDPDAPATSGSTPSSGSGHALGSSASRDSLDAFACGVPIRAGAAVHRPSLARHSIATGGSSVYGGARAFRKLQPPGVMERTKARMQEHREMKQRVAFEAKLMARFTDNRCSEIDAARDSKLALSAPLLADFAYDIAQGKDVGAEDVAEASRRARNFRLG